MSHDGLFVLVNIARSLMVSGVDMASKPDIVSWLTCVSASYEEDKTTIVFLGYMPSVPAERMAESSTQTTVVLWSPRHSCLPADETC